MKLSPEEKAARERERMIEKAKAVSLQTYRGQVARIFQRLIRAEAAALDEGYYPAVRRGIIAPIYKCVGECVCITCGNVMLWNHKGCHAGHWIGRVHQSTLFVRENLHPQCASCNQHGNGMPIEYLKFMVEMRGQNIVDRLLVLKHQPKSFSRDELVDMRIEFSRRLKSAVERMKGNT